MATKRDEQKMADEARGLMAEGYMNQVGIEWDEACEDAERQWGRLIDRAQGNFNVAYDLARIEYLRHANM